MERQVKSFNNKKFQNICKQAKKVFECQISKQQDLNLNKFQKLNNINKNIQTLNNNIVKQYKKKYNIQLSQKIYPQFKNKQDGKTIALWLSDKGIIPPKQFYHNKLLTDDYGDTVQKNLVSKNILPPKEWIYSINDPKDSYTSIIRLGYVYYFPVPYQWENPPQTIFYKAMFREIPDIAGHKSDEQDEEGFTVAMILACNNIDIPKEWEHDPSIQNDYKMTVAMYMAKKKKIPPKQWQHDPQLRQKYNQTVAYILVSNNITPPKEWEYKEINIEGNLTVAYEYAQQGIVPPSQWHHDPYNLFSFNGTIAMILAKKGIQDRQEWFHNSELKNSINKTVAIILAENGYIPQQQWYHNPRITNYESNTVAMLIAKNCKAIPDNQWYHNPLLINIYFSTVAIYLAQNGIFPPKEWIHNINYKNKNNNSIKSLINEYLQKNNLLQNKIQEEKLNNICSICLQEGKQNFIKTTCGHKVCSECFKQLQKFDKQYLCPICRQQNWYQIFTYQNGNDKEWFNCVKSLNYFKTLNYNFEDAPYINRKPYDDDILQNN